MIDTVLAWPVWPKKLGNLSPAFAFRLQRNRMNRRGHLPDQTRILFDRVPDHDGIGPCLTVAISFFRIADPAWKETYGRMQPVFDELYRHAQPLYDRLDAIVAVQASEPVAAAAAP